MTVPPKVLYAARMLAAEHRPVPLSEGVIYPPHAAGCLDMSDRWYEVHGAADPQLDAAPEVWAAHYGPPCRVPDGWPVDSSGAPAPICVACSSASENSPPMPHPCGTTLLAAHVLPS